MSLEYCDLVQGGDETKRPARPIASLEYHVVILESMMATRVQRFGVVSLRINIK